MWSFRGRFDVLWRDVLMRSVFKFLKAKRNGSELCAVQHERKEDCYMKSEFLDGIDFEENPLVNETPDRVVVYDFNGNEVVE